MLVKYDGAAALRYGGHEGVGVVTPLGGAAVNGAGEQTLRTRITAGAQKIGERAQNVGA